MTAAQASELIALLAVIAGANLTGMIALIVIAVKR